MDIVGAISGATLGYITGGFRGARLGYKYGKEAGKSYRNKNQMAPISTKRKAVSTAGTKRKVSKKRKMTTSRKIKAARSVSGWKVPKRITKKKSFKKTRETKNKKTVAAIVQRTLDKNTTINVYRKNYCMDQKVEYNRPDLQLYIVGGRRNDANTAPFTEKALQFTPISVEKILDAASILWNGKTVSIDSSIETGNFDLSKTSVHVQYASWKLELRNFSPVALDIEVIEVTNKDTYNSDNFFKNMQLEVGQNNIVAYNYNTPGLFVDSASDNQWAITKGLKFTDVTGLEDSYKWKVVKRKRLLHGAGMKIKYTINDKKVDLSQYVHGSGLLADYCRGDKQLLLKVTPVLHAMYNDAAEAALLPLNATFQTLNSVFNGLIMHCSEVFKIAQPSNTTDANEGHRTILFSSEPITAQYPAAVGAFPRVINEPREVSAAQATASV